MNLHKFSKIILLVEPNENIYRWFSRLLKSKNYKLVRTVDVSEAVDKVNSLLPDLIICNYEQNEYDGFYAHKLLRNSVLKNGVPFIVLFPDNSFENIQLGLELGIDNFIFPPYKESKTIEIIKNTLIRVDEYRALKLDRFEDFFGKSPMGVFITRGEELEKANAAFYKFLNISEKSPLPNFDELFEFENNPLMKKKLKECFGGKISDCFFSDVVLKYRDDIRVDLQISHLQNYARGKCLVQMMIKNVNDKEKFVGLFKSSVKEEEYGITTREIEVLKFSSKGFSIKQIAKKLDISDRTVEKHRSNIMRKTNTANIIEALSKIYTEQTSEEN